MELPKECYSFDNNEKYGIIAGMNRLTILSSWRSLVFPENKAFPVYNLLSFPTKK